MSFSAAEKLRAVERELAFRRRNYPNWVRQGRIEPDIAGRQIAIFEAIVEDYETLIEEDGDGR